MSSNAKPVDWDRLAGLFEPGSGVAPPHLAGREDELKTLNRFLAKLGGQRPAPRDLVLYGPRGNGKTVLLAELLAESAKTGAAALSLTPRSLATTQAMALALLQAPEAAADGLGGRARSKAREALHKARELGRTLPDTGQLDVQGAQIGAPGIGQLDLGQVPPEHLDASLRVRLAERCRDRPLVVGLDEAHALDTEVGRSLLNLSQELRAYDRVPFFLVLAGTPGLEARLRAMGATFWERSERIGIGRLDPPADREALTEPLKGFGVAFDEDALAEVLAEAQRYPYFLQVWGEALCEALAERKAARIGADIVEAARPAFEALRTAFYEGRYKEIREQGLLPEAEAAAALFAEAAADEPRWTSRELEGRLRAARAGALSESEAMAELERLSHLGLVWQPPGEERLEAGIPSLMDHVLRKSHPQPEPLPSTSPN